MSVALDRLAAATDVSELPQIKIDIDAEHAAEKVLHDSDIAQYDEAKKVADEYRTSASKHQANMLLLESEDVVGKKYVELLNA